MSVTTTKENENKTKTTRGMPNIDNATVGFLMDEVGRVRDLQKVLKKHEGFFLEAMKARHDPPIVEANGSLLDKVEIKGENYTGTISFVEQLRFDTETFQKDHPDLYAQYKKPLTFFTIKGKKNADEDDD